MFQIGSFRFRAAVWAAGSLLLLVFTFMRINWADLARALSYNYIVNSYHVAPWGVLALAALLGWAKRQQIRAAMAGGPAPAYIVAGLAVVCLSFLVPVTPDFFWLRVFAVCVGVFAICFGQAARIPLVLLAVYAFTIYFPLLVDNYLGAGYISTAVVPVSWLLHLSGLRIMSSGQVFQFSTPSGHLMAVLVSSTCAGPTTMAVFVAIFTFMMLDLPLPWQRAVPLFLFGVIGTWLQNVIRIIIILCSGYFLSEKALWTAHFWTIYVLFPLWYLLFAAVYFRYVQKPAIS